MDVNMDNEIAEVQRIQEYLDIKIDGLREQTTGCFTSVEHGFDRFTQRLQSLEQTVHVGLKHVYDQNETRSSASTITSGHISWNGLLHRMFGVDIASFTGNPEKEVESKIVQLQQEIFQLQQERTQLWYNINTLEREKEQQRDSADRQFDTLKKRYAASELQKQKFQESSSKLRDIIVKNGSDNSEPVDSVVTRSFGELRDLIQKIVHKHCSVMPRFHRANNPLYDKQRNKFDTWYEKDIPEPIKKYRSRAVIFELLNEEILAKRWFGLDGTVEFHLAKFETDIDGCPENNAADVAEWRKRTIECASWLNIETAKPKEAARRILQFMEPLQLPSSKSSPPTTPPLDQMMLQLCEKAYQLTLALRRSKSTYTYENIRRGTVIDEYNRSDINPQAYDGPQSEEPVGATVVFTIFGALVKYPNLAPNERHVLEQSHVVLRD